MDVIEMAQVDTFFEKLKEDNNNLIIFFDNDKHHVEDMEKNVTNCLSIKVSDEKSKKYGKSSTSNKDYMLEFKNTNEYAELMHENYDQRDERFPICDGITQEHIDLFVTPFIAKASDEKYKDKQKIAIFDFDRTLTIMEGFLSPPDESYIEMFKKFKPNDVALFLFGGQDRINMLISMYTSLKDANFQVLVLTNNSTCSNSAGRLFFISIIKEIFGEFTDKELICSESGNGLPKSQAFNNFLTKTQTEKPKKRMLIRTSNMNVASDSPLTSNPSSVISDSPSVASDSPFISDSSATAPLSTKPSMFSKLKSKMPSFNFTFKNPLKGGKRRRTKRRKTIKRRKTHRRRRYQ